MPTSQACVYYSVYSYPPMTNFVSYILKVKPSVLFAWANTTSPLPDAHGGLLAASHSTPEDRSLRTLQCHILFCLMGEIQSVLAAGRTKAQLCRAAHNLGHLRRLPSNSPSNSGRVLIMSPTSLAGPTSGTIVGARLSREK